MRLICCLKRWMVFGGAMTALLGAGCFGPRTQVAAPRAAVPAYSQNPMRALPQANGLTRRPVSPTTDTRSALSASRRPDWGALPSNDLARGVARFSARPSEIFNPPTPIRSWRFIVLHHSAEPNGGLASIDRFHREVNKWDECGYHFVIGNGTESGDGEIEVGGRWLKQKHGAHTRLQSNPGSNLYNEEGIGICLVGDFDAAPPTPKQVEACRRLVAYLQDRCRLPAHAVTTHGDLDNTECPGRYFPRGQVIPNRGFAVRP